MEAAAAAVVVAMQHKLHAPAAAGCSATHAHTGHSLAICQYMI